jgi:hypothetical protein
MDEDSLNLQGVEGYDTKTQQTTVKAGDGNVIWDVKFCPFIPPGLDPIFAVVASRSVSRAYSWTLKQPQPDCRVKITICRALTKSDTNFEVIRVIVDEQVCETVIRLTEVQTDTTT